MENFWDESIWCPPGLKWSDYGPDTPQFNHLYYSFLTAGALTLLRYFLEVVLFRPIGGYILTKKKNSPRSKLISKFSEGMWKLTFYLSTTVYGWFFVLWNKPYSKDMKQTLINYPHAVTDDEWWYYNIELGFYLSLFVTQFFDTKRKDFWQMFVHHIVTILLIFFSWTCCFHRVGCLVMAIHDVGDIPLESAKLAKYCEKQRLADIIFAIFAIVWIYTRCYLLPTRVIYYSTYEALGILPFFPAYYFFNTLLCLLQLLHVAWTYLIIRIAFDALQNKGMRDIRSDSEDTEEDPHTD